MSNSTTSSGSSSDKSSKLTMICSFIFFGLATCIIFLLTYRAIKKFKIKNENNTKQASSVNSFEGRNSKKQPTDENIVYYNYSAISDQQTGNKNLKSQNNQKDNTTTLISKTTPQNSLLESTAQIHDEKTNVLAH